MSIPRVTLTAGAVACCCGLFAVEAIAERGSVPAAGASTAAEVAGASTAAEVAGANQPAGRQGESDVTRRATAAAVVAVEADRTAARAEPAAPLRWRVERQAYDGPVLGEAWFAERRVVVYLVPPGGLPAVRGPAAAVIRGLWTAGDWSLKHVFVSGVPSKPVFLAGRRIGLHDLATAVTEEAGQGEEFVAANEDYVRQNVFFVHDPEAAAWTELLGAARADGRSTAVVMLDGGRVVKAVDVERFDYDTAEGAAAREAFGARLAGEVRELLPSR